MFSTIGAIGFWLIAVLTLIAVFKTFPGAGGVLTLVILFIMYAFGGTALMIAQCFIVILITLVHGLGGFCWTVLAIGCIIVGKI